VFVLARALKLDVARGGRAAFAWFALIVCCLASSLSAYGALLLLVVLMVTYPVASAFLTIVLVSSFGVFYTQLPNWESVRAVKVILALVESRGSLSELMVLDASFYGRITSFMEYVRSFVDHPFVGNGFSLYQSGGFVSIVAAFGIVALAFFTLVLARILRGEFSLSTKAVLLSWLLLTFLAGPIGIPILGVIIGTLLRPRRWAVAPAVAGAVAGQRPLAMAR
jgi:hypothetical protein